MLQCCSVKRKVIPASRQTGTLFRLIFALIVIEVGIHCIFSAFNSQKVIDLII